MDAGAWVLAETLAPLAVLANHQSMANHNEAVNQATLSGTNLFPHPRPPGFYFCGVVPNNTEHGDKNSFLTEDEDDGDESSGSDEDEEEDDEEDDEENEEGNEKLSDSDEDDEDDEDDDEEEIDDEDESSGSDDDDDEDEAEELIEELLTTEGGGELVLKEMLMRGEENDDDDDDDEMKESDGIGSLTLLQELDGELSESGVDSAGGGGGTPALKSKRKGGYFSRSRRSAKSKASKGGVEAADGDGGDDGVAGKKKLSRWRRRRAALLSAYRRVRRRRRRKSSVELLEDTSGGGGELAFGMGDDGAFALLDDDDYDDDEEEGEDSLTAYQGRHPLARHLPETPIATSPHLVTSVNFEAASLKNGRRRPVSRKKMRRLVREEQSKLRAVVALIEKEVLSLEQSVANPPQQPTPHTLNLQPHSPPGASSTNASGGADGAGPSSATHTSGSKQQQHTQPPMTAGSTSSLKARKASNEPSSPVVKGVSFSDGTGGGASHSRASPSLKSAPVGNNATPPALNGLSTLASSSSSSFDASGGASRLTAPSLTTTTATTFLPQPMGSVAGNSLFAQRVATAALQAKAAELREMRSR
jgi:hypothetical protein